jgi:hypothetical protein
MNATRAQIAKIHILKKKLGIEETDYKNHLLDFGGVEHSNELDYYAARNLIIAYESGSFMTQPRIKTEKELQSIEQHGFGEEKYSALDGRGELFAKSSKLRKIEALWREVSYSKTDEALQSFIKNRVGIDHITFLHSNHAKIIITALENMKNAKIRKQK